MKQKDNNEIDFYKFIINKKTLKRVFLKISENLYLDPQIFVNIS